MIFNSTSNIVRALYLLMVLACAVSISELRSKADGLANAPGIPTPSDVLGFTPGDDRKLASWANVVECFQKLDAASARVKFEDVGKPTMGSRFVRAT